ncbi:GTPase HflX [candidate division WOR-3 bacterium]|nr:GTPase HflX [candidate division WOR-3 bacterium]
MKKFITIAVSGKNLKEREKNLILLNEMDYLLKTLGYVSCEKFHQEREKPDSRFYAGKGKIEELRDCAEKLGVHSVVFINELTGSQIRNIEKETGLEVSTRKDVILEIFKEHAGSKISKAEVETAQLRHRLSRIVGGFDYLSRPAGGIGTKGPGETKLETEKRAIKKRISYLGEIIKKNKTTLAMQKERRKGTFRVSLVGYTNSGKTTLLNVLTGAGAKTSNIMFSTIDTTTRRMKQNDWKNKVLISDTVGFIEELPFELVESFKSTLEEVADAELRLLVADFSEENYSMKIETVKNILQKIGCSEKETLILLNKMDISPCDIPPPEEGCLLISGKMGIGLEDLKREILKRAGSIR